MKSMRRIAGILHLDPKPEKIEKGILLEIIYMSRVNYKYRRYYNLDRQTIEDIIRIYNSKRFSSFLELFNYQDIKRVLDLTGYISSYKYEGQIDKLHATYLGPNIMAFSSYIHVYKDYKEIATNLCEICELASSILTHPCQGKCAVGTDLICRYFVLNQNLI